MNWLNAVIAKRPYSARKQLKNKYRRQLRPWLERLEDRCLLAQLAFAQQPPPVVTDGSVLGPIEITVSDQSNPFVTIAMGLNPGDALLAGTATRQAVQGKALFTDLVVFGGTPV